MTVSQWLPMLVALLALCAALAGWWTSSRTRINRALLECQRRMEEVNRLVEDLAIEQRRARMREHARQMTKDRVAKRAREHEDEAPDPYREPEKWKSWMSRQMTRRNGNGEE